MYSPRAIRIRRIPGGAHSCIALPNELNSGILFYEFLYNGIGGILRTIVNYNDFQGLICLRQNRMQRLSNVFRGIESWNDYRY